MRATSTCDTERRIVSSFFFAFDVTSSLLLGTACTHRKCEKRGKKKGWGVGINNAQSTSRVRVQPFYTVAAVSRGEVGTGYCDRFSARRHRG